MLRKMGEKRPLGAEHRRRSEGAETEVAPLELALAQVAPLGKGNRLAVVGAHLQRVAVDKVLRQHVGRRAIEFGRLFHT